jgi:hypothetical protein
MRPSQKYGIDDRNVVTGITMSTQDPRHQPASTPSSVPRKKLMTVVMPTRPSVHGRLSESTSDTGVGKKVNDRPRSPRKSWPM